MLKMRILQKVATMVAATALIVSTNPVLAADMLGEPTFETVEETAVEFGSGWYIRGDLGAGTSAAMVEVISSSINGQAELGVPITASLGVGFELGESIRAEATFNQFSNLSVSSRSTAFCGVNGLIPITGSCYNALSADPSIASIMASGYYDIGEFYGFTPYIGAGLGAAFVSWKDFKTEVVCQGSAGADCDGAGAGTHVTSTETYDTEGELALAYNIMLGAGYRLSQNVTLDAGYRFTSIGAVTLANTSSNNNISQNFEADSTDIHEFRIGVRYEIW